MLTQYRKWMSMQNHFKVSAQRNPKCWFCSSGCKKKKTTFLHSCDFFRLRLKKSLGWPIKRIFHWKRYNCLGFLLGLNSVASFECQHFFLFFWMIEHTSRHAQRNAQAMQCPKKKKKRATSHTKGLNMLNVHNSTIRNDLSMTYLEGLPRESLFSL